MLRSLKQQVLEANLRLPSSGLVSLTWGNVSGLDPDAGLMVIKPSGIAYADLRDDDLVVLELATGRQIEGKRRPSSDTPTHLVLYRAFPGIRGICHTHSPHATMFSQAGRGLPCYGTTHADHFHGTVPLCRALTPDETAEDYEGNTGHAIVQTFHDQGLDPLHIPGILQLHHAPFTWGTCPMDALNNSIALEMCARMAIGSLQLNPDLAPIPPHILDKHHHRKHGPGAYYGQPSGKK
ncbi:MAG: araD [Verrucomicrobiales bacterium]|nr:araD [Verrucomicrobiales bacterium]